MTNLRSKLIRLAHSNPELRADLLPLLKTATPQESTPEQQAASAEAKRLSEIANEKGTRSAHAKAASAHRAAADLYPWGHLMKSTHKGMAQMHKQKAGR
jgi:hypothetical protein